jgi:carbon-monoxide dehydrogenase medium subunit
MIPANFDYIAAKSLDEAISLLAKHKDDAKILAGGHSLLPAMKLRLMQPKVLIDLGRIRDLSYIKEEGGQIRIGAMTTHFQAETSDLLCRSCPLLPETASHLGDMQVRNKGTIGGSLAHSDPAADWPAAILAPAPRATASSKPLISSWKCSPRLCSREKFCVKSAFPPVKVNPHKPT